MSGPPKFISPPALAALFRLEVIAARWRDEMSAQDFGLVVLSMAKLDGNPPPDPGWRERAQRAGCRLPEEYRAIPEPPADCEP